MWWEWLIVIILGGAFNGYLVWKMIQDNKNQENK